MSMSRMIALATLTQVLGLTLGGNVLQRARRVEDAVEKLPGLDSPLSSKHFSGFLTVDETIRGQPRTTHVHYWLMESERSPSTDPVVLWYNGGPPCSSLVGAFTELGPYRTTADSGKDAGALELNPYRWNKNVSLLFIESPSGVGFSYSDGDPNYAVDDIETAELNLNALLAFYRAYPELAGLELFLAGESYAGVYVPMLAQRVVQHNADPKTSAADRVRLKGMLVGNGAIATGDWYEGWLTGLRNNQAFTHGLFSPQLRAEIVKTCKNFTKGVITPACTNLLSIVQNETGNLNVYDLRETCLKTDDRQQEHIANSDQQPLRAARRVDGGELRGKIGDEEEAEDPCDLGATDLIRYLTRADVQRALHVENASVNQSGNWVDCGGSFGRGVAYTRVPQDERVSVYPDLIGSIRILIYNGDQDNCIPYTQDEAWTSGMGLKEMKSWHPWLANHQVGGYAVHYEKDFSFTTIKGAGHMCPTTQPERSLHMLQSFVNNKPL
eukprot:m.82913 g.82913  ORF g.82913 m.82913 type:complete len:497 (+) comp25571_c0_seq2:670-2160(+)